MTLSSVRSPFKKPNMLEVSRWLKKNYPSNLFAAIYKCALEAWVLPFIKWKDFNTKFFVSFVPPWHQIEFIIWTKHSEICTWCATLTSIWITKILYFYWISRMLCHLHIKLKHKTNGSFWISGFVPPQHTIINGIFHLKIESIMPQYPRFPFKQILPFTDFPGNWGMQRQFFVNFLFTDWGEGEYDVIFLDSRFLNFPFLDSQFPVLQIVCKLTWNFLSNSTGGLLFTSEGTRGLPR